jgi:predicted Zn-dependent protease
MNEKDYTLLDDYFNGLLSPEDATKLLDRTRTDQAFGDAFRLRQDLEQYPARAQKRDQFLKTIQQVANASETTPTMNITSGGGMSRWLSLAAAFILAIAAIWFFTQPKALPNYEQYATHTPLSITLRGATDMVSMDAEKAFNAKNYETAKSALSILHNQNPDNVMVKLYFAICRIELNQTTEARAMLESIANGNSALKGEAIWYIALSHLRDKNKDACKTTLQRIAPGDKRYKSAQALLKDL